MYSKFIERQSGNNYTQLQKCFHQRLKKYSTGNTKLNQLKVVWFQTVYHSICFRFCLNVKQGNTLSKLSYLLQSIALTIGATGTGL